MKVDETYKNCGFADDVLSYVYNELPAAARDRFDEHLAGCSICIDELAELSYSFYTVHEWRQLDFDPLPTPVFLVPSVESRPSLAARIIAVLFPTPARLAFAGSFGALIVAGSIAFNVIDQGDRETSSIAHDVPAPVSTVSQPAPPAPTQSFRDESEEDSSVTKKVPATIESRVNADRDRVTRVSTRPAVRKYEVVVPRPTAIQATTTSPRLSDYEDSPDDSLRLSDLLDETDARD